jgi:hypothetical protein
VSVSALEIPPRTFVSSTPWPSMDENCGAGGFLWATHDTRAVYSPMHGRLPQGPSTIEWQNGLWRRFEMPSNSDATVECERVDLETTTGQRWEISVASRANLPARDILDEVAELLAQGEDDRAYDLLDEEGFDEASHEGLRAVTLLDRHADYVYRLSQRQHAIGPYQERVLGNRFLRSVKRVALKWRRVGRSRIPPLSLIVQLADELSRTLENVCQRPRLVLRREREMEPAARIREIDQSCIRWLGRQPGRTLQQKAGSQQRLLGVVRREDCDTPENRIVRELLVRCRKAGRAYVARFSEFQGHPRLMKVQKFVSLCEKLMMHSPIGVVSRLVGIGRANYVLQHESRYRVLWDGYLRLVRNEQVTQSTWSWRQRVWNDWFKIGCLSALDTIALRSPGHRTPLTFLGEPVLGRHSVDSHIGAWWLKQDRRQIHLLNTDAISEHGASPSWLASLCPDLLVFSHDSHPKGTAIWTQMDVVDPVRTAEALAASLAKRLTEIADKSNWRFWIVVGGARQFTSGMVGQCVGWSAVPLMLQDNHPNWSRLFDRQVSNVLE